MVSKFLQYTVSFTTDTSAFSPLAQVCLALMRMKTNHNKKTSELLVGVTGRVIRHWNRGWENSVLRDVHSSAECRTQHNMA